jgi:large subunit ribosomal protein L32
MANPKRRTSHRRKNQRRSHDAIPTVATQNCPNCGEIKRPHHVCESCGFYDGVQVVAVSND